MNRKTTPVSVNYNEQNAIIVANGNKFGVSGAGGKRLMFVFGSCVCDCRSAPGY